MIVAFLLCLALVTLTLLIHIAGLRLIALLIQLSKEVSIAGVILASHAVVLLLVMNIAVYAIGLFVADTLLNLGDFAGARENDLLDYFYFSAQTFTALGYGDLVATDNLRILLSIEPLNGLLLIAWSGAFTYFGLFNHLKLG
jgi:hypothetical protein